MKKQTILLLLFCLLSSLGLFAQVNFSSTGLNGVSITNPTSLDFGPDGRLYVSVQSGEIYAYTVQRQSATSYSVVATELILDIQQIQNHDDDGALHSVIKRQVTGILADGTAINPVLYVSSSDYRIGGGGGGSDKNLDSNSGMVSKLSWNGSQWERVDLVRGLPRSEENHATNGMQLDKVNNILYLAVGGHTNAGAPSNNFALITEYALSAAIVSIDLNDLNSRPTQTDAQGAEYIYDLPTLDDPTRANVNGITDPNQAGYDGIDINDPFGGNDGLNQAKWVVNGPVQVYAAGFRNAYDIVLTDDGRMYTWDNGANQGWGGHPDNEGVGTATNNWVPGEPGSTGPGPNDAKVNNKDGLHFIDAAGYYGGHPNPIRANPLGAGLFTHDHANGSGGTNGVWRTAVTNNINTTLPVDWPPVDPSLAQPIEGDFQNAGVDDLSLFTITASTNGMVEYRASNFNGSMQGDLLAASFNGNIYRVSLNAQGSINSASDVTVLATGFGAVPLDVTAQSDDDIFPGTIWAATYGSNSITIFEPQDFSNCSGIYDASIDEDNDGYTNADEIDNQTNPCSGASFPTDNDQSLINGFKVSDLNDPDDDDDGLLDTQDPFALDATDGQNLSLVFDYPLLNGDPGFGLYGLGFTGLMTNLNDDYLNLYLNEDNSSVEIIAGGAVGLLSFNNAANGSPLGNANDLTNGFQFGLNVSSSTLPFEIETALVGPLFQGNPQADQYQAFYIGNGDQDNFIMIGAHANQGSIELRVWVEENGTFNSSSHLISGLGSAPEISFFLEINPLNATIQPKIDLGNGVQNVGGAISFPSFLNQIFSSNESLAIGVAAGKESGDPSFNATYDFIKANYVPNTLAGDWTYLHDGNNCTVNGNHSSCPQGRHEASYVEAGDQFVLIGGREHGANVNFYDPINGTWKVGAAPPVELHHYQAVEHEGLIYAFMGMTGVFPNEIPVDRVYIYDPVADQWHEGPEIPVTRRRGSAGAVVRNGKFYILGGIQNGHVSGWVPWFDEYDPATNTWTVLTDAPRARDHFHATITQDKLYAAGGRKSGFSGFFGGTVPEVDIFDFNTNTWSTNTNNIPSPQAGASVAVIGDELLLIGGESSANLASNLTQALNLSNGTWRNLDTLNTGRHGTQAIVNNQTIYLPTGSDVKGGGQLLSQEVFSFGSPQALNLIAINKSNLIAPGDIDFGTLAANQISQQSFYLKNSSGTQAILIDSIQWAIGINGLNFNPAVSPPFVLSAGDSVLVNLSFNANADVNDTIEVYSIANNSFLQIPVKAEVLPAEAIRVNCGGPALTAQDGAEFDADIHFLNGSTYSKVIGISNTNDPELYQTERWAANLAYSVPLTANGTYEVKLHFAEIYGPNFSTGARVMNVSLEGNLVRPSLDIFDTVGGYAALVLSYTVEVNDGSLDLSLEGLVENAKLSAFEISPQSSGLQFVPGSHHFQSNPIGNTDSISIDLVNSSNGLVSIDSVNLVGPQSPDFTHDLQAGTAIPASYTNSVKVYFNPSNANPIVRNAQLQVYFDGKSLPAILNLSGEAACPIAGLTCDDGDANTINDTTDGNCNCFGETLSTPNFSLHINAGGPAYTAQDGREFTADQYFLNGNVAGAAQNIANTSDPLIYTSERWAADLAYAIPVPQAATYRVTLHFAEIWTGAFSPGKRIFSMWLEDSLVIQDLDLFIQAGSQTAYVVSFDIPTDDTLNLTSLATENNAKISAISIESLSGPAPLQGPSLSATALDFPARVSTSLDSLSIYVRNPDSLTYSLDSVVISGSDAQYFAAMDGFSVNPNDSSLVWLYFQPQGANPGQYSAIASYYFNGHANALNLNLGGEILCPSAGSSCDDGDSTTINDVEDGNCNCSGTPVQTPAFSLNINCGGPAHTSPITGKAYIADQYNIGGYTHTYNQSISGTQDSVLYSTSRIGRNMSYVIPIPDPGTYQVTLHFAEVQNWLMFPNKRVFDISAEGQLMLDDIDIVSITGGGAIAHNETFTVDVLDGVLNLNTAASKDNSLLIAIEISSYNPIPEILSLDPDQLNLSSQINLSDSASFHLINLDTINRSIDSVVISGAAATYVQTSLMAGSTVNASDSIMAQAYFNAPAQAFGPSKAIITYYSDTTVLIQEINVEATCPPIGTSCDDGDSSTVNDVEDGNCNCAGTPISNPNPGFSLNINCGGSALVSPITGKSYIADQYNIGGYTHTYSDGVANTLDSALYSTARIGRNMSYSIPVPQAGNYQVTLHFAETQKWLMGPNRRVFDISVEGQLQLDDIDIFVLSGGGASAHSETFVVAVNDGELDINTAASKDNSLLVAIEIEEQLNPITLVPLYLSPANAQFSVEVNQGAQQNFLLINSDSVDREIDSIQYFGTHANLVQSSLQATAVVSAGDTLTETLSFNAPNSAIQNASVHIFYFSDQDTLIQEISLSSVCPAAGTPCDDGDSTTINDIQDGSCNCAGTPQNAAFSLNVNCGGPAHVSPITGISYVADQYNIGGYTHTYTKAVSNTLDSVLYSTCRIGRNMGYYIPVPNQGLYEVTLHFAELQGWLMGPGRRVFDISAEGQLVLDDVDIFSITESGATAHKEVFTVQVSDGELALNTAASVDNSLLVAIEVKEVPANAKMLGQSSSEDSFEWSVYPNPLQSGQSLILELTSGESSQLDIVNGQGQLVYSQKLEPGDRHYLENLSLNPGVYIVYLKQEGKSYQKKLLIN